MIIRIQVKPNSRTDSMQVDGETIQVKICAAPVEGKANKYLVEYLSNVFKIPKSKIEILKGRNSFHKIIELQIDEDYAESILKGYRK